MPVRNAADHRTESHALGAASERGETDPAIGVHRGMVEDEAAVESERLHLASGIEQSTQARVAKDELYTPADPFVSLGDPWMTCHAWFRSPCSDARARRFGDGLL